MSLNCEIRPTLSTEHAITLGNQSLLLLGERAVYWPAQRSLLIADLHLGKADTLRRAGILAPRGSTSTDLDRLARLIERHQPETLWVLGDLLHGPILDAPWIDRWKDFRRAHRSLSIQVIAGNHDRQLTGTTAQLLELQVIRADVLLAGLCLCHEPPPGAPLPTVSGHLHPCVRLPGLPRRWPAFRLNAGGLILPAFSLLTGGALVQARDAIGFACVEGQIVALQPSRCATSL